MRSRKRISNKLLDLLSTLRLLEYELHLSVLPPHQKLASLFHSLTPEDQQELIGLMQLLSARSGSLLEIYYEDHGPRPSRMGSTISRSSGDRQE